MPRWSRDCVRGWLGGVGDGGPCVLDRLSAATVIVEHGYGNGYSVCRPGRTV